MSKTFDYQKRILVLQNLILNHFAEIEELRLTMGELPIWENVSIEDLDNEQWKPIIGFEELYQVSDMGRVKSLCRYVKRSKGNTSSNFITKAKIMIPHNDGDGYHKVYLYENKRVETIKIHRLVGKHFIENPENKEDINHKNGIKKDNRVSNLEWATRSENIKHAFKTGLSKVRSEFLATGGNNPKSKPVEQYSVDGKHINTFGGQQEAARITGVEQSQIWGCCNGKGKTAGGFIWKYAEGFGLGKKGANTGQERFKFNSNE